MNILSRSIFNLKAKSLFEKSFQEFARQKKKKKIIVNLRPTYNIYQALSLV
jgi:hypothetical protein